VFVAAVFGWLTLVNNRRSKDTQERATLIAATDKQDAPQSLRASRDETNGARLTVRHNLGERWQIVNEGPATCIIDDVAGLTTLDKKRLEVVAAEPDSLSPGETKEFILLSRLTLTGPANIVVSFRLEPGGSLLRQVLLVPAP
jgi:ABC-type enterochelin transport system substrate-binding protein